MKKLLILCLLIVCAWGIGRDQNYIDEGITSGAPHMPLPDRQGNLVLVDSSANLYSGLFVGQDGIAFSFWVNDLAYDNTVLGQDARYPSSLASSGGPHIGYPILTAAPGWGHMGASHETGGWFSSFWGAPVDMSGDIGSQGGTPKELPNGNIVNVADLTSNDVAWYTYPPDLSAVIASGNFGAGYDFWSVDVNGGICYVFVLNTTTLEPEYFTTTDGETWTGPTVWNLTWPNPFTNNVIWMYQMALTDAGDPILVFEIRDGDDGTWPINAKSYVQTASGATPVQISDDVYDAGRLPFVATGGDDVVVMWLAHTNALEDSLARWDAFWRESDDNGANWSTPKILTDAITDRPCLTQIAKRLDVTNGKFFYVLGTPIIADIDLEWADWAGNDHRLDPIRWWVGWEPLVGIEEHETETPSRLTMNVTTPASRNARISYALTNAGEISLKVYDRTGSLVRTIETGYKDAGVYNRNLDVSELANGTYFVRLVTSTDNLTRSLIVIH
jgi:hypothetical protein